MSAQDHSLKLLVIGAHPDDAEYSAGGLAALYRKHGHSVRFLSMTNGSAGHHQTWGQSLVERRREESRRAAEPLRIESEVWENEDGQLVADLDRRANVIRAIRTYRPDLVLTHRPNDYHPDHRATSLLVQDAAYLLTVPAICPDVPHLPRDPVIAYLADDFQRPYRFEPNVVVDIASVWEEKISMLDAHASQFYEWLPTNMGRFADVPKTLDDRRAWLDATIRGLTGRLVDRHRAAIVARYGEQRGTEIDLIEAFEGCEYGSPLDAAAIERLFTF
jgi:LmbE family N-acetylglucosaminyl deacetylase